MRTSFEELEAGYYGGTELNETEMNLFRKLVAQRDEDKRRLDAVVLDIAFAIDSRGDNNVYGVSELNTDDMIVDSSKHSRTFLFADADGVEYRCTIEDITNNDNVKRNY